MVGEASGVTTQMVRSGEGKGWTVHRLVVTNDQPSPVRFEAEFQVDEETQLQSARRLDRRDGRPLWVITVPANGTATLQYRLVRQDG